MNPEIKSWLSFAVEKLDEIVLLSLAVNHGRDFIAGSLKENFDSLEKRGTSSLVNDLAVVKEMNKIDASYMKRKDPFEVRSKVQQKVLNLPLFPTTSIGSFPQTKDVRVARQNYKNGKWTKEQYDQFMQEEIKRVIRFQEEVGLDVLVHGEPERNDMVEYFGEHLNGFVFSSNGWVQSYGSRCVKPPIIFGDVSRPTPITIGTLAYAQSLTSKKVKGMLTGPVTILQWSFVRDDQPRQQTTFQIALALRKEVCDLEAAGISVIQIDEPAIREGLPLKKSKQGEFLKWAVEAFLISSCGVRNETQIHTHMCYSDFNDIFQSIKDLDADCITIENSKSDLKLLGAFDEYGYQNYIGPGLYDIHSARVPGHKEMKDRLTAICKGLKPELVWINPDCGLKTRGWEETRSSLSEMVSVAKECREEFLNR
jgi:5-methyltetrahydropteroyltriglutamate--homocysteine methyltransferase